MTTTTKKKLALSDEAREKKRQQAKAQWAARNGAGGLRAAVVQANTKQPPANVLEIVETACAHGCTVEQIAGALGINRKLFGEWRERYPEIEAAMTAGRAVEHDALVGALFKAATREKGANLVAAIFLLKARHGYQEGVALVQNSVSINYQLPAPLSPAEYIKTIEAEATLVKPDAARALMKNPQIKTALKNEFASQRRELEQGE
jgi:transposase-like protein